MSQSLSLVLDASDAKAATHQPSAGQLQKLLDSSLDVICCISEEGRFITVSAAACDVWGYEPRELVGRYYIDLVVDEDKAATRRAALAIRAGVNMTNFENRYTCKDGSIKPVLWSSRWSEEDGVFYSVARDATQKKEAEAQRRLQESRLYSAYHLARIGWWEYCLQERSFTCSEEVLAMLGLPVDGTNKRSLEAMLACIHPQDRAAVKEAGVLLLQNACGHMEHRVIQPGGAVVYIQHFAEVITDSSGAAVALHGSAKDISLLKESQLKLEASEKDLSMYATRLSEILESFGDGFFATDRRGNITYWNNKAEELLNRKREEVLGKNLRKIFPKSLRVKYYEAFQQAFLEMAPVHFEEFLAPYQLWLEVSVYPSDTHLSVFFKNISERKRQERALQVSNERFLFACQATSDVVWDWNLEEGSLYISPSFTLVFGYGFPANQPLSQLWSDNLHPEDRERVVASQAEVLANPKALLWKERYRFFKASGEVAYVSDRAVIVRSEGGAAVRMIGAVKDITREKQQEKRLEFIAKATSEVIWERGIDEEEVEVTTEKFNRIFGYNLKNNRSKHSFWLQRVHPDDIAGIIANRERALKEGLEYYQDEYRFKRADETWAFVRERTYLIKNDEGQTVSLLGAIEDVTAQRMAERALVESELSYRELFTHAPLPMIISDAATLRYLDVNNAAIERLGYSREEFLEKTVLDIRPEEERARVLRHIEQVNKFSRNDHGVLVYLKKNGETMQAEVSAALIDYKGRRAYLATINDVTEKLRLQAELTRGKVNHQKDITKAIIETQEKERSEIGKELHDNVNQMLTTAKLYVENIGYYPEQSTLFASKSVGILQGSINEIRRLSRALVTPTIRDVGFKDTLHELVASYLELRLFEVYTSFYFDEALIPKGVKLTIYRILQEAFNNTVKYAQASKVQVLIRSTAHTLKLVYTDDGVGFDPATVKRGIGLQNIQNRTDAYRGKVQVRSSLNAGCELKIVFPLAQTKP